MLGMFFAMIIEGLAAFFWLHLLNQTGSYEQLSLSDFVRFIGLLGGSALIIIVAVTWIFKPGSKSTLRMSIRSILETHKNIPQNERLLRELLYEDTSVLMRKARKQLAWGLLTITIGIFVVYLLFAPFFGAVIFLIALFPILQSIYSYRRFYVLRKSILVAGGHD